MRDSAHGVSADSQLNELLRYKDNLAGCDYEYDSTHVLLLQRISVMYFQLSDYKTAIRYGKECIGLITSRVHNPSINQRSLADNYFNLGQYYGSLGATSEKISAFDSCISIAVRMNVANPSLLYALNQKVDYLFDIGEYQRCIFDASAGEMLTSKCLHGNDSINYALYFFIRRVNSMIILKSFSQAEELLRSKLTIPGQGGAYRGNLYALLGQAYDGENELDKALECFHKAYQYDRAQGYKKAASEILNDIGFAYAGKLRRYDLALTYYQKALALGDFSDSLNILGNMADIHVRTGHFDAASRCFQQALDQIKPGVTVHKLLDIPVAEMAKDVTKYLIGLILDVGDAHLQEFKVSHQRTSILQALDIYKSADLFLDKIRAAQSEETSELFLRNNTHRLYEHAIESCHLLNNPAQAFYFIEKSRAALLIDHLAEQSWSVNEDILERAQLEKKIEGLKNKAAAADIKSERYSQLQTDLLGKRQQLDRLEQSIRLRNPVYSQSFLDTGIVTSSEAQARLATDRQSLIELFTGDSADYLLLVTPKTIQLSRIDKADLDSTAELFSSYLSDQNRLNARFTDFTIIASHLYQLLFGALPPPAGRTIVSLDIRWIPFEALITQMSSSGPRYFVSDHTVSYTYSFRYLSYARTNGAAANETSVLGVAPVRYSASLHLPSLVGSDRSLDHISSRFPHFTNLQSAQASRNNFLRAFYHYSIIQLYTHAADNSNGRDEPVIYFADSALYLSELIPESKPLTQLIVLSACETGSGHLYRGEGVFSFNRGFAALGIPSSIANLWAVEDQSTYRITELFYHHLSDGLPADSALQQAKLDFIGDGSGEKSLPYYWAAPVFAGDGTFSIPKARSWPLWALPVGLLVLASLTLLLLRRRYRRP